MDIEGYNESKPWSVVVALVVFVILLVIWYDVLYPGIKQANASRTQIAQIDFWKIVAGEKPIPQTPEGELARDLRIVYFDPSTPRQRFCALVRLTNRNYRGIVISVPIYARLRGDSELTIDLAYVNEKVAKIIARKNPERRNPNEY